jgi:hypothetical protein
MPSWINLGSISDQSRLDLGHNIGGSIFAGKHLLWLPGPSAEAGVVGNGPHADRHGHRLKVDTTVQLKRMPMPLQLQQNRQVWLKITAGNPRKATGSWSW